MSKQRSRKSSAGDTAGRGSPSASRKGKATSGKARKVGKRSGGKAGTVGPTKKRTVKLFKKRGTVSRAKIRLAVKRHS